MSKRIFVLGESGTGKSTSLRNLEEKTSFILQCVNKDLPFKGWKGKYTLLTKDNLEGNRGFTRDYKNVHSQLKYIAEKRHDIKTVIIDDSNYLMANDFMGRVMQKATKGDTFSKYNEMAYNFYHLMEVTESLRDDLTIIFMAHTQTDDEGNRKFKTVGKLIDNMINLEGLVTMVLETSIKEGKYVFQTNKQSGLEPCKTPFGMFDELFIENDINIVLKAITDYEN